jgi:hypothetical protein
MTRRLTHRKVTKERFSSVKFVSACSIRRFYYSGSYTIKIVVLASLLSISLYSEQLGGSP